MPGIPAQHLGSRGREISGSLRSAWFIQGVPGEDKAIYIEHCLKAKPNISLPTGVSLKKASEHLADAFKCSVALSMEPSDGVLTYRAQSLRFNPGHHVKHGMMALASQSPYSGGEGRRLTIQLI